MSFLMICLFSWRASSHGSVSLVTYLDLQRAYDSASVPFDLPGKITVGVSAEPAFSKCSYVSKDGKSWEWTNVHAIKFTIGMNTFAPTYLARSNEFVDVVEEAYLLSSLNLGAVFRKRSLDMTDITSWQLNPACSYESVMETFYLSASSVNVRDRSYQIVHQCADGRVFERTSMRKSGADLIM
ncbi:MAG: hypothetical protein EOP06_28720, partial [Proteobacteria bacterium]